MRRISGRTLWLIFSSAVVVLVCIAIAADFITARYSSSEDWVSHTQQVSTWLIRLRSDLATAEAARLAFVSSQDPVELPLYDESSRRIPLDLDTLDHLTTDNPAQQTRIVRARPLIEQRLGLLQESINLAKMNSAGQAAAQQKLTLSGAGLTQELRQILDQAQADEEALLHQRETFSNETYKSERGVLALAFVLTVFILAATFWTLLMELKERRQAEEVVRQLSGRLLKVQDQERRRIARELHDSLGQLLSSLKMNLDQMASRSGGIAAPREETIQMCLELTQQSLDETRTLSYLLHPPLLDEFGFASAAKWYVDGFVKRSKIDVKLEIAPDFERLPEEVELALFRVLQESLTNIHRHSGSPTAEIVARSLQRVVTLQITDHGKGISPEVLEKFRRIRGGVGVGLAGMRERIEELGGNLNIESEGRTTVLEVKIPVPEGRPRDDSATFSASPPQDVISEAKASSASASAGSGRAIHSSTAES
ncbi:MAG TPA: CHASE3 domain-containing protein [Candidatus Acidoferrales bacterium]|nr:CHASE3 domain-containing protein [Candidatus Acidoferrales bacterium]